MVVKGGEGSEVRKVTCRRKEDNKWRNKRGREAQLIK